MPEQNIVFRQVVPDIPRSVESEQTNIYVPVSSQNNAGISKFDPLDFIVTNEALVQLRYSERNIVKNADPLTVPSYVKLDANEFEYSSEPNQDYPKASVVLRRDLDANNTFEKRSLVKLSTSDFEFQGTDGTVGISWPDNPFAEVGKYGFKLDPNYFNLSDDKILSLSIPKAYEQSSIDNGFGTVKIDTSYNPDGRYLQYDDNGILEFNEEKLERKINNYTDWTYIRPNYANPNYVADYLQNDPNNSNSKVAIRKNYFLNSVTINGVIYEANTEIPSEILSSVDASNIYTRTEFLLDKSSVGLSNVENVSVSQTVSSHNSDPNAHEGELVGITSYNTDIGTSYVTPSSKPTNSNSVKEHISYLQDTTEQIRDSLSISQNRFKGYFKNDNGQPYKQPSDEGYVDNTEFLNNYYEVNEETGEIINLDPNDEANKDFSSQTYLIFANTGTVWCVNVTATPRTWYNFGVEQDWRTIFESLKNTDSSILKPDQGAGVVGTSEFWAPADHAHPLNPNVMTTKYGDDDKYLYFDTLSSSSGDDFKAVLNDFTNEVLTVKIPYIAESQYAHNWKGDFTGGVPSFTPGTSTNGRYMKLWAGTSDECVAEFGGNIPDDVVTIITGDTTSFDGEIVDETMLNQSIQNLKDSIVSNTSAGKTYLFNPTSTNTFSWEEVDMSDYMKADSPINFVGSWKFNSQDFAIFGNNQLTDPNLSSNYYKIQRWENSAFSDVSIGNTSGKYLVYSDVSNNIVSLIDSKYLVKTTDTSETGKISDAILALWTNDGEINETLQGIQASLDLIEDKVNVIPSFPTNNGSYLLTKNAGSTSFTVTQFNPDDKLNTNYLIQQFTNATGPSQYVSSGTISDGGLTNALSFASRVVVHTGTSQSADSSSSYSIWHGDTSEFEQIQSGDFVANRLYIVYQA